MQQLELGKTYIRKDGETFTVASYIKGLEMNWYCDDGLYRTNDGRVLTPEGSFYPAAVDWSWSVPQPLEQK